MDGKTGPCHLRIGLLEELEDRVWSGYSQCEFIFGPERCLFVRSMIATVNGQTNKFRRN